MATKEIPEALSSLFGAILEYQDTQDALARLRSMAESVFGQQWRDQIFSLLSDCPAEQEEIVKTNINRAFFYEKAIALWTEVSQLLDPRRQINRENIINRLPDIKKTLSIFGAAGQDLVTKLETKLKSTPVDAATAASSLADKYGLTIEQLWNFDHFLRLKTYYDLTISRTSARCVHLGGLELTQYPYYGYILDLLDEILTFGMEIITPPYARIVQDRFKGGVPALKKIMMEFKSDFENNAPPEMLSEDDSLDEIKLRLGQLADNTVDEGDIGPAPDGFEAEDEENVQPQQHQQSSANTQSVQAKMPVKVPVKVPVRQKVLMKRPVSSDA